jgi:hypothetical protein
MDDLDRRIGEFKDAAIFPCESPLPEDGIAEAIRVRSYIRGVMKEIEVEKVERALAKFEEIFNAEEQAFMSRWQKEREVWRKVSALGGKFRGRKDGKMIFSVPENIPLEEGWELEGKELRVDLRKVKSA